ncbi:MAG: ATP-binding protein [bacterium]
MKSNEISGFFLDFASLEKATTPMYVVNPEGKILFMNGAMRDLFGYSREGYLGKMIAMLGKDPERTGKKIIDGLNDGGGSWQGNIISRAKDAREFPCLVTATRFIDSMGNHTVTLGQVMDLTDQRKTEADLKLQTDRLSSLVQLASRIAHIDDPFTLSEKALEEISGLLNVAMGIIFIIQPVTGDLLSYSSVGVPDEDLARLEDIDFRSIIASDVVRTKKTVFVPDMSKDSRIIIQNERTQSLAVVPLASQDRIIGAMGLASKTPYTFTDEDIRFMETVGAHLGVYLENARLFEELDLRNLSLKERNLDLEELLSIISHDLRSPLATIGGYASLLTRKGSNASVEETVNYAKIILRKTNETSRRFDDLLNFFRVTMTEDHKDPEPIDVLEVISDSIEDVVPSEVMKHMKFTLPEDIPSLIGNRNHLTHIFTNIISNSYKFMGDQKDPAIHIHYSSDDEGRNETHSFTVIDNGMGITGGFHENLLKPFFRGPGSQDIEGAGMGLSIVDRIIKKNMGNLEIESREGHGTTVTFTLPWPRHSAPGS